MTTGVAPTRFVVFDAGALIAIERGSRRMQALLERMITQGATVLVPAAVVGQTWRDGSRQARIAKLLAARQTGVVTLDGARARAVGVTLAASGTDDVVDASVVLCAREHGNDVPVLTSDPDDLGRLDERLVRIEI